MLAALRSFGLLLLGTVRDLAPIVLVVAFFQIVVLQQPIPNLERVLPGLLMVMLGLTLFIQGLELGLFPLGESMAEAFARKGSLAWLLAFAFALGFGATVAEPALIAVAGEAAEAAAEAGFVAATEEAREAYADGLRLVVALSVGFALMLGVIRTVKGWPIHLFIIAGYVIVLAITPLAPAEVVGFAYDLGGVTTSTVTVPLVTALGVGLATAVRGRSPLTDGFGMIALACLMPIIFALLYGTLI